MNKLAVAKGFLDQYYDLNTDSFNIPMDVVAEVFGYWPKPDGISKIGSTTYISDELLQEDDVSNKLYQYAIIHTNKKGEYKELLQVDTILAPSEEKAKMLAFVEATQVYGDDFDPDRLEVVVRPF
jgi:hypothetical protein